MKHRVTIVPMRHLVIDEAALAADGWVAVSTDAETRVAKTPGGDGWGVRYDRAGKLCMIVTCGQVAAGSNDVLLVLSVSHRHGTRLRDTERFLSFVTERFRPAMASYAGAIIGPAQVKWLANITAPATAQA